LIAFLGLAIFHLVGSVIRHFICRCGWRVALASPSSAWFAIAVAFAGSLGVAGMGILVVLGGVTALSPSLSPSGRGRFFPLVILAVVVLARPWVPTAWDEFIWLGKARFESLGFGAGIQAALDPAQHVIPAGYPPLWPAAVGWLSLGDPHHCSVPVATVTCQWLHFGGARPGLACRS